VIVDESKLQLKGFFHYLENTKIVPAGSYNADLIIHEFLEQVRPSEPERPTIVNYEDNRCSNCGTDIRRARTPDHDVVGPWHHWSSSRNLENTRLDKDHAPTPLTEGDS
jgi:hypothetical protein